MERERRERSRRQVKRMRKREKRPGREAIWERGPVEGSWPSR